MTKNKKTARTQRKETITAKMHIQWKIANEFGFIQMVADKEKIHRETISLAIDTGKATPRVRNAINRHVAIKLAKAA